MNLNVNVWYYWFVKAFPRRLDKKTQHATCMFPWYIAKVRHSAKIKTFWNDDTLWKKCFAPSLQTKNRGSTKSPLSSHQISTKFANFWSFFQKWMQHCTTKHVHYSSSCVSTSNWNSVAWFNPSLPCVVVMDNGNLYLWVKYNRRNFRSLLLPLCSYMGKFPVQVLMTKAAAKKTGTAFSRAPEASISRYLIKFSLAFGQFKWANLSHSTSFENATFYQ